MEQNDKTFQTLIFKAALLHTAVYMRVDFFDLTRSTTLEEYNRDNPIYPLKERAYKIFKKLANEILKIKPEKRNYYVRFTKYDVYKGNNGKEMRYQNNCGFCVKSLDSYSIKRPFDSENTVVENLIVKDLKTKKVIYKGKNYQEYLKKIRGLE